MPTLQYPKNPNTDTAFVVQDDGTKNRALMIAPQDISTLELPSNPNSTKGYVTVDGKKQRVILVADVTGGGGDQHNMGYYTDPTALRTAHPTAEDGDWAIVGTTDTVWVWDSDSSDWVDTDTKGQVTPDMIIVKSATMPTASTVPGGSVYQYVGSTNATYTHGYIYENVPTTTSGSASASQTVGSGLSDIAVDLETLESFTGWTTDNSLQIFYTDDGWSVDTTSLGITYTGTPSVGDAITVVYTAPVTTYAWVRIDTQPEGVQMSVPTAPTLAVADWSSNTQTVTVTGVTASNTVIVSPAPASAVEYAACGILCTTQGTDSLTFTCTAVPANALTVNVVILN